MDIKADTRSLDYSSFRVVVKIRVPFWVPKNIGCRTKLGTQKGTIILTTTHLGFRALGFRV